jgi:ribosomal protein S12 methylthiotransferase accessory factor YcaO
MRSKDIDVYVKDLSFGGELPCVGAYFFDPHVPQPLQFQHFFKVGSAFDREEALIRCFTEYTQGRGPDEFLLDAGDAGKRALREDFRSLKCMDDECDNYMSAFMFGMVPFSDAAFLKDGPMVPFDKGARFNDCRDDVEAALRIFRKLGKDCIAVDYTDPDIGFPVVGAIVPGYSDVLPYHPRWSTVLFKDCTREDVLKSYEREAAEGAGGETLR